MRILKSMLILAIAMAPAAAVGCAWGMAPFGPPATIVSKEMSSPPSAFTFAANISAARILRELMLRWPHTPRVELVTTDGFLYPNKVLEERGLLQRKGFPESYDRRALLKFVADVKSGELAVEARQYSHLTYDVLPANR